MVQPTCANLDLLGSFLECDASGRGLRTLLRDLKEQVKNVSVFRQMSRGRVLKVSVHPAIDWCALAEIRVDARAELAITPVGLFLVIWLAMIAIHTKRPFLPVRRSIREVYPADCSCANPVKSAPGCPQRNMTDARYICSRLA